MQSMFGEAAGGLESWWGSGPTTAGLCTTAATTTFCRVLDV